MENHLTFEIVTRQDGYFAGQLCFHLRSVQNERLLLAFISEHRC